MRPRPCDWLLLPTFMTKSGRLGACDQGLVHAKAAMPVEGTAGVTIEPFFAGKVLRSHPLRRRLFTGLAGWGGFRLGRGCRLAWEWLGPRKFAANGERIAAGTLNLHAIGNELWVVGIYAFVHTLRMDPVERGSSVFC